MDTAYAVMLLVTAVATVAYWLDFFLRGSVHVVEEEWYIRFERAFPVADTFMAVSAIVGAVGLLSGESFGVAFALVAASAFLFLALMDVTFNVENGLYRYLRSSPPMRAELVINLWFIGLGVALLAAMVGRVG